MNLFLIGNHNKRGFQVERQRKMSAQGIRKQSKTDWVKIKTMKEIDIDFLGITQLGARYSEYNSE